ncbi:MAG: hypothetical protein ACOX52_20240 [Verrucomicrobiota bacterium]
MAAAVLPSGTKTTFFTAAPRLACQGKPLSDAPTTSRAALPTPEITPATVSAVPSTPTVSVCPTIRAVSWFIRIGLDFLPRTSPVRSTTTGYGQPASAIWPPV